MSLLQKEILYKLILQKGSLCRKDREELGLSSQIVEEIFADKKSVEKRSECYVITDATGFLFEAWLEGFNLIELAYKMNWRDFEGFVALLLKRQGYTVHRNLRFKAGEKRYELDILASRFNIILAIDCKRWVRAPRSKLKKAALAQEKRAKALAMSMPINFYDKAKREVKIIPLIVSLIVPQAEIFEGVPVVNIYSLKDFLENFELYEDELKIYKVKI